MSGLKSTHFESSAGLRFGIVTQVDGSRPQVKVYFEDLEMESHWLHVPQDGTAENRTYKMLYRKGTQVAVLLDPYGEEGVVLGAIYSDVDPPPVTDPAKWHKTFEDGTVIEYDTKTHELKADVKGSADIKTTGATQLEAQSVTVKAMTVNVEASVSTTISAPMIELDGLLVKTPSLLVSGMVQFAPPLPPTP